MVCTRLFFFNKRQLFALDNSVHCIPKPWKLGSFVCLLLFIEGRNISKIIDLFFDL